jgi:hypothetical protein
MSTRDQKELPVNVRRLVVLTLIGTAVAAVTTMFVKRRRSVEPPDVTESAGS